MSRAIVTDLKHAFARAPRFCEGPEKSHASLAQFRTETRYASLWGEQGGRILT